jgi:Ca2+-transporting ATPase
MTKALNEMTLSQSWQGLSTLDAAERLRRQGFNELPSSHSRHVLKIAWEIITEPIFLLLLACGLIYRALGEAQEAWILLGFVAFIVAIELYQEQKTERSLEALRDLSSPRALVIRDGIRQRIAGRDVVLGDLIVLAEGDRVPADARLLWSTHLSVDESLLTGESVPVRKQVAASDTTREVRPGGEDQPFVFSGTLVVQGQGIAEVVATGAATAMGRIGKALQTVEPQETRLQRETRRLVGQLLGVAIALCLGVIGYYGLTRGNWLEGILAGLAMAMASLPNEIPVVLAIFLALGAWRFSKQRVLTRRTPVVETLGSATVLCVDKTGTLTQNRMSVQELFVFESTPEGLQPRVYDLVRGTHEELPESFHGLIEYGILASRKDPFDPMEKALQQIGQDYLRGTEHLHPDWTLEREYPLSGDLLAMSCVWRQESGELRVAAKGAPEAIADLCHFSAKQASQLAQQVTGLAEKGLRVLGVAWGRRQHRGPLGPEELPSSQHEFQFEFVGLIGLADPIRPSVPGAIAQCQQAGVRVVMITGDYPATALNIGRQIGLPPGTEVLTGAELEQLDDLALKSRIRYVGIFARVVPEQKLRIVQALQADGEIVAMTGDGVNDAPALKAAHIGIAMGDRGTDVAREAADLVLLDDDFASIVAALSLGRRIFDNLRKGLAYTLAVHLPIVGLTLLPVIFGWPLILMPIHIAFLHLIIDPACTVVFEAEPAEPDTMQRPPRPPKAPLFDRRTWQLSLLQGVSVLGVLLIVFAVAYYYGEGTPDARALTFTTLIVSNLSLILANRSWRRSILQTLETPNPALWWVLGGGLVFLLLVLYVPSLRLLFRFSYLHPQDLAICLVAGLFSVAWFELLKLRFRRTHLAAR